MITWVATPFAQTRVESTVQPSCASGPISDGFGDVQGMLAGAASAQSVFKNQRPRMPKSLVFAEMFPWMSQVTASLNAPPSPPSPATLCSPPSPAASLPPAPPGFPPALPPLPALLLPPVAAPPRPPFPPENE